MKLKHSMQSGVIMAAIICSSKIVHSHFSCPSQIVYTQISSGEMALDGRSLTETNDREVMCRVILLYALHEINLLFRTVRKGQNLENVVANGGLPLLL